MKLLTRPTLLIAGLLIATPLWAASSQDDSSNLLRDPNKLSRNDVRMSAEKFISAWLTKDNEQEQLKANMYLLGVMDATEGKEWCSYDVALPGSLRESIYSYFKKLPQERKREAASKLIIEALVQDLPCKKGKQS